MLEKYCRGLIVSHPAATKAGTFQFNWGERTYIMGIVNITPDSFSGDGLTGVESAVEQAGHMIEEGADILDIGGESTRPGFTLVEVEEEIRRVVPVIEKIAAKYKVPISIDSYKYEVVRQALAAGATIINDQWGLKSEPRLAELAAQKNVPIILMSNQREKGSYDPSIKRDTAEYIDVVAEVAGYLKQGIETAFKAGVKKEQIIVDPGLGFGKTWQHDLELIRRLDELKPLGYPILLGPSRKSFIKMILNVPANERVEGTAAAAAIGIAKGADILRVHDVKAITRVSRVSDAIIRVK
jgi:dihydropteroate synthase